MNTFNELRKTTHCSLWEKPPDIVGDTATFFFQFLQVSLGLAALQLGVEVAAAGLGVQAQELSGHTHLLNVSDGVVTLSEQFYRNRIYVEITYYNDSIIDI